jgi:hypothetical protein
MTNAPYYGDNVAVAWCATFRTAAREKTDTQGRLL